MTLCSSYPGPAAAARFRRDIEGWGAASLDGSPLAAALAWAEVTDRAFLALDITAACRFTPETSGSAWYFAAPDGFVAVLGGLADGTIAIACNTAPAPADASPRSLPDIVLRAPSASLGLRVATAGSGTPRVIEAGLSAPAGWVDLASGDAVTADAFATVLSTVTGMLVRGGSDGGGPGELYTVELYPDPLTLLATSATAWFDDGALSVQLTPSPFAAGYRFEVRGAGDALLFSDTAVPSRFSDGQVTLAAPDFQPVDGAAYSVQARALGSIGPDAHATFVQLTAPIVTIAPSRRGVRLGWSAIANADGYRLRVVDGGGGVVDRALGVEPGVELGLADGLVAGTDYQAQVRARSGAALGPWSAPAAVRLPTAREILQALLDRIQANRGDAAVTLNAAVLPADAAGAPDRLLTSMTASFGESPVALTVPADPALDDISLTVRGTGALLGDPEAMLDAVFTVEDEQLQLVLTMTPSPGWRLSDGFDLAGTAWDELPLEEITLVFSSAAQADAQPFAVAPGLNLRATLLVSPHLTRLRLGDDAPDDVMRIRVGGTIATVDAVTILSLAAADALGDLAAVIAGFPALVIGGGQLALARLANPDGTTADRLEIAGTTQLGGGARACILSFPSVFADKLDLAVTFAPQQGATLAELLTIAGGSAGVPELVGTTFGTVAISAVDELRFRFDPAGRAATEIALRAAFHDRWEFVPGIAIEEPSFSLSAYHFPDGQSGGFTPSTLKLSGTVRAGAQGAAAELAIRAVGDWELSLVGDPPLTLAALGDLAGFDGAAAFAALPSALRPAATIGLADILLAGMPAQAKLSRARFTFVQTEDWSVGGVLAIRNSQLSVDVDVAASSAAGYFLTTVALGPGDDAVTFSASGPVPPEAGQPWSVALDEGQQVTLPGVSDMLSWFGGNPPVTASGLASLSGIVVDRMLVRFDPAATPVLRQIAISAKQASDWVLIGPDALKLSNLAGHFDFSNAGGDLTLGLCGSVTVLGTQIDAALDRLSPNGEWTLRAQAATPIAVPAGVSGLDAWASPEPMLGYLGAAQPLAGPANFGALGLVFDGGDGALKRMAFGLGFDLGWELIPGKLSIDSLTAQLSTAVPVASDSWTGRIEGQMTLFDARLLLSATKPAVSDPWLFRGELVVPAPVDLAASAGSLTHGLTYRLPSGAADDGLPAAITIDTAEIEGAPETGYFHFRGAATFTDWSVGFGAAQLQILAVGGDILIKRRGDPLRVRLTGSLAFAGARIETFVSFGTSPEVDTIIAGVVSDDSIAGLSLSAAVDAAAGANSWSLGDAPAGFSPPGLTSAGFYLNLGTKVLALYGQASLGDAGAAYARAALVVREVTANGADSYDYAFVAEVTGFRFAKLAPALSVLDEVITLREASIALSSFRQADGAANPLAVIDAVRQAAAEGADGEAAPDAPATPAATRIETGLNVYGVIGFEGALWQAVSFVLDLRDAELTVQAAINRDDPESSLFVARLTDATLLAYLHFPQITLEYRSKPAAPPPAPATGSSSGDAPAPRAPPALSIGGDGRLTLPGVPDISFYGRVEFVTTVNGAGVQSVNSASLDAGITASETSLFGIPRVSLTLSRIHMAWTLAGAQSEWRRDALSISATATLASYTLNATLDLSDGTTQSIVIALDTGRTLSLRSLLVDWLGAAWLDGAVPDLTFSNGWLKWTKPETGASTYALHAEASLIGFAFVFDLTMTDGKGVTGSAAPANIVDFGFIKLAGPQKTGGPVASLTSNDEARVIALDSCTTLFDRDFAVHLDYTKPTDGSLSSYHGTLQTSIDFGSLGTLSPTLIVSYSEGGALDVKLDGLDIPWDRIKQAVKLAEQIKTAMEGADGACRIVGDLGIGDDFLQCLFNCSFGFPRLTPQSGSSPTSVDIDLVVNYGLKLNLPGFDQVIFQDTLTIPAFSIAPTAYTFAGIAQALTTALIGAVPNIVVALFKNPGAVAKLGAAIAAQEAAQAALRQLACKQSEDSGDDADEGNESGESGGGGWAGAIHAFSGAFFIAAGILGLLGAIIGALTGEDERRKRRAEEQRDRAIRGIANLTKPTAVSISCVSADTMRFGCMPPADVPQDNGATYDFTLYRVYSGIIPPLPVPPRAGAATSKGWMSGDAAPQLTVAYDGLQPGAIYYVAVTARVSITGLDSMSAFDDKGPVLVTPRGSGVMQADGDSEPANSAHYAIPDIALGSLTLEQVGAAVAVDLAEGNDKADEIRFAWVDRSGQPVGTAPQPIAGTAAHARHTLRLAPPVRSGEVILRATAKAGDLNHDTVSDSLTMVDLPAPAISSAGCDAAAFEVRAAWAAVDGAGGYRLHLFRDDRAAPVSIGTADTGSALAGSLPAGSEAGFTARVRVATLPPSGPGAVWSEPQAVVIPGAAVSLSLAAVAEGQSPDAFAFTVSQDQPPPQLSLLLMPGDSATHLGAAKVAAFSATRAEPVAGGASFIHRIAYTLQDVRDAVTLSAPLGYDWPAPQGTSRVSDVALELPGGIRLWQSIANPLRNAIATADRVPGDGDRMSIMQALDSTAGGSANRAGLLAISRDPEALAALAPLAGQAIEEYVGSVGVAFAALGQPVDIVTLARVLTWGWRAASRDEVTLALDRQALEDQGPLILEAAAFRAAGLTMTETAVRLRTLWPQLTAAELAVAFTGAYLEPAGVAAYAAALVVAHLPAPVVGRRVLALAGLDAPSPSDVPDDLALRLLLRRVQGMGASEAAVEAKAAEPSLDAARLGSALAAAYFQAPSGRDLAAAALAAAFAGSQLPQQHQGWALVAAGVPVASAARLIDLAGSLPADAGERLRALTALLAPDGAPEIAASLLQHGGSPLGAARAARAVLAPLSAGARLVALANAYLGLAAQPAPLAAALAVSGSTEADAMAALISLAGLDAAAAAAAWAEGAALAADYP